MNKILRLNNIKINVTNSVLMLTSRKLVEYVKN